MGSSWLEARLQRLDVLFAARLADAGPAPFRDALVYPLQGGGKRIRPAVVFAACEAVSGDDDPEPALLAAGAVELVHTYSLVHDDLPAMDDDDVRRGRPTVHKAYGEAAAILVGDALLTEAFSWLAEAPHPPAIRIDMVSVLATAAGARGMVRGQALDIGLDGPIRDEARLTALHADKTGALFRAAAALGALAGHATDEAREALTAWAADVGLAFQLADDCLDADQDHGADGPPSFVRLRGLVETQRWAAALVEKANARIEGFARPQRLQEIARFAVDRDR